MGHDHVVAEIVDVALVFLFNIRPYLFDLLLLLYRKMQRLVDSVGKEAIIFYPFEEGIGAKQIGMKDQPFPDALLFIGDLRGRNLPRRKETEHSGVMVIVCLAVSDLACEILFEANRIEIVYDRPGIERFERSAGNQPVDADQGMFRLGQSEYFMKLRYRMNGQYPVIIF